MPGYDHITFLTDYGLENVYTGVCRGVMARIAPAARVLDLTHLVPRGDVRHGGLLLAQSVRYLPERAVHLGVVDPGVGTARRPVVLCAGEALLVGPDNGLLIPAAEELGGVRRAFAITPESVALEPMSATFHGRDLFAPAAARLAGGWRVERIGTPIPPTELVRPPRPLLEVADTTVRGEALLIDRFGNVQTSVTPAALATLGVTPGSGLRVRVGQRDVGLRYVATFGDVPEGELLAHPDSSGTLALAVNRGDAAALLGLSESDRFTLRAET